MIDFQPEDRTQQRLVGGIATLIYAVSVLLLLLLLKFQLLPPPDNGEGLMINFGNVEEAAPGADLAMNDQATEAPQQPQQQAPPQQAAEDEQLTQDFEETDVVVREKKKDEKKTPKKEDKKVEAKPKPEQKPVEKPREVNRKALFPGPHRGQQSCERRNRNPGPAIRGTRPERRKEATKEPGRAPAAIRRACPGDRWSECFRNPITALKTRDAL